MSHGHLGTPQYTFANLTGTTNDDGITITHLVSKSPVAWACICNSCGTAWTSGHTRAMNGLTCPNAIAHGRGEVNRSQTTITIAPNTAVRSRDAQSAREYQRQETPQSVRYSFTGEPDFSQMSPEQVSSYLTNVEGR